jgi:hypothetical protein
MNQEEYEEKHEAKIVLAMGIMDSFYKTNLKRKTNPMRG